MCIRDRYLYIAIAENAEGGAIKAMATVKSVDVDNDSISISDTSGDWLNIAGDKVIGEPVIGTGVFDSSTDNVATITGSNKRWIDSNNTQNIDIKMISPEGEGTLTAEEFSSVKASMVSSTHRQDIVNALAASGFTLDDVFSYSQEEETVAPTTAPTPDPTPDPTPEPDPTPDPGSGY